MVVVIFSLFVYNDDNGQPACLIFVRGFSFQNIGKRERTKYDFLVVAAVCFHPSIHPLQMGYRSGAASELLTNSNSELPPLPPDELEKRIDDIIAIENPYFGERSLKRLSLSFISRREEAENESWTL